MISREVADKIPYIAGLIAKLTENYMHKITIQNNQTDTSLAPKFEFINYENCLFYELL